MSRPLLLIIEDDETIALSLKAFFRDKGYEVDHSLNGKNGLQIALKEVPDVIILDVRLTDMHGIEILKQIKENYPEISVIIMTAYGEIDEAVNAMKLGAEYYFTKPIDMDELAVIVEKGVNIKRMKQEVDLHKETPFPIIGKSKQIQGLRHMINLLAKNPSITVLIQGETGTGKELVAKNIHALSERNVKPFIDLNCAAIPDNIVESELFGYEVGAFTDAKKTKKGLFEMADGGTIFLDEIGDMAFGAQAKVLRIIENKTLKRLGGARNIIVDVRMIAASNKNLESLVKDGLFREDLFFRLNVMPLVISPLDERPEDIPLIADFLLHDIKITVGKKTITGFSHNAMNLLCSYKWPGNVRELRNVIERATILCNDNTIRPQHVIIPGKQFQENKFLTLKEVEEIHIKEVLKLTNGNRTRSAQILGIARSTLNEKIKSYKIS